MGEQDVLKMQQRKDFYKKFSYWACPKRSVCFVWIGLFVLLRQMGSISRPSEYLSSMTIQWFKSPSRMSW